AAGIASEAFLDNGSRPISKKLSKRRTRSERFLRMHITTASTSSLSSANSSKQISVSLEASGANFSGKATYKILLTGFRTDSHLSEEAAEFAPEPPLLPPFLFLSNRPLPPAEPTEDFRV
uniref:Uncharacterized protein n=1 Tax=Glossina palpalis gambiensis TaxID=67801 RepID=A0A1B0BSJ0_9MUSC